MARVCVFFPGFLGSRLVRYGVPLVTEATVWFRPWSLIRSITETLRMPDDPAEDGATSMRPNGTLEYVYDGLLRYLRTKFDQVLDIGYDFRRSVQSQGQSALVTIERLIEEGHVLTMVGHSMGGLVGFASLRMGDYRVQQRFNRAITLGTPWGGSYRAVNALQGQGSSLDAALYASLVAYGYANRLSPSYLASVLASWSGIYDLMPSASYHAAHAGGAVFDHNDFNAWTNSGINLNPQRLQTSSAHREQNRVSLPGVAHVNIVGSGFQTECEVLGGNVERPSLVRVEDGDGVVQLSSARFLADSDAVEIVVPVAHVEMGWKQDVFNAIDRALTM